jgi:transcriptional regulator with XRE-family HTH domain
VNAAKLRARFGQVVRRRRLLARLGQEALADRARIHRTHLSLIERGKRTPTLYVVHLLARALGTTMVDLIADVESENQPIEEPPPLPKGRPRREGRIRK